MNIHKFMMTGVQPKVSSCSLLFHWIIVFLFIMYFPEFIIIFIVGIVCTALYKDELLKKKGKKQFKAAVERLKKLDSLLKEFPADLAHPVDASNLRKIVAGARQNSSKRCKLALEKNSTTGEITGPSSPSSTKKDKDDKIITITTATSTTATSSSKDK